MSCGACCWGHVATGTPPQPNVARSKITAEAQHNQRDAQGGEAREINMGRTTLTLSWQTTYRTHLFKMVCGNCSMMWQREPQPLKRRWTNPYCR